MPDHRHHAGRIFWGLILVIFGVLFLLDRLGEFNFGDVISTYWPVILIILGFAILIGNGFRRPVPGLLFIVFGVLFLLAELDILRYSAWHYIWPILIIILGLWLLLRPAFFRRGTEHFPEIKGNDIDVTAVFSGLKRRIESASFRGGQATAVMGGVELDFTSAGLADGKASLDATVIFGGMDIRVPRDWRVVVEGTPILGGIDDKRRSVPESEAKATLYVRATAVFGAIAIKE
jgi:predicted membrane protein